MDGRVERRTRTEGRPIRGQSLSINMKNYLSVSLLMTDTLTRAHARARVQEQVDLRGSADGIFSGINRDLARCNDI